MNNKIEIPDPVYFFPELLPFLRKDLLPGLEELSSYIECLHIDPSIDHGLTTRVSALRDDLINALAGVATGNTQ